jgi:hypothetical protein
MSWHCSFRAWHENYKPLFLKTAFLGASEEVDDVWQISRAYKSHAGKGLDFFSFVPGTRLTNRGSTEIVQVKEVHLVCAHIGEISDL